MTSTVEQIVLDPVEVAGSRTSLDITPWIRQEGIDWGNAEISAQMSEQQRGEVPIDYRVPNRQISIPFRFVGTNGGTTAMQARANVQAKLSLFQQEGGWIKRITNAGSVVYADVVDATFTATSVAGFESAQDVDIDAQASLECIPDFYGDEVTLSDHTETTNPELVFTETSIAGDYPGRVRIVVDDDSGNDQRGLIWAFRSRNYSSASTAATKYEAESLEPLGDAIKIATTGASGGTAVGGTIWPIFTPLLGTRVGGTSYLTHTGTNRLFARCWTQGTVETYVRAKWDVNDLVNPTTNSFATVPNPGAGTVAGSAFYYVDLGEVRLDPSPVGTHRWQGQIEARTSGGTAQFRIDRVNVVNMDEGFGRLTAPVTAGAADLSLQAFDDFSSYSVGGTLSALAAPKGGNWDEAGDTDDFIVTNSFLTPASVVRTALSDADLNTGQYAILDGSSSIAGLEIQTDVALPESTSGKEIRGGVLARYVDTNNWLMAVRRVTKPSAFHGETSIALIKRVAGTVTMLANVVLSEAFLTGFYTVKLTVDANGNAKVYTALQGSALGAAVINVTSDADLTSGGALDDGKVGIYDATDLTSGTYSRYYTNFEVLVGDTPDTAVIFANRSAQLTTAGHYRMDVGGTAYGPVAVQVGDLPRIPVAGLEGRTTELFIKDSRGDFETLPDSAIDDISARIFYRPSYLFIP